MPGGGGGGGGGGVNQGIDLSIFVLNRINVLSRVGKSAIFVLNRVSV